MLERFPASPKPTRRFAPGCGGRQRTNGVPGAAILVGGVDEVHPLNELAPTVMQREAVAP